MLQIANLIKRFPPAPVLLNGLNLAMEKGDILALMGPSGCGKTTLLRLVAGLEVPDQGTIHFAGPNRPSIGYVGQVPHLYPHLNVEQNLAIGWQLQYNKNKFRWWENRYATELRQRLDQVVQLLELAAILDRPPASLSGGERQRVSLGRTLVRRPAVFLLDEPTAYLDRPLADRLMERLLGSFREWRATVLWITHQESEARIVSDRLGRFAQGRLILASHERETRNEIAISS